MITGEQCTSYVERRRGISKRPFDRPAFLDSATFWVTIDVAQTCSNDASFSSFERDVLAMGCGRLDAFSTMSQTQNFDHAVFCSSVPENCSVKSAIDIGRCSASLERDLQTNLKCDLRDIDEALVQGWWNISACKPSESLSRQHNSRFWVHLIVPGVSVSAA
jgi:hypothetical protein